MIYILASFLICVVGLCFSISVFGSVKNPTRKFVPKTESNKTKVSPFGGISIFFASGIIIFFNVHFESLALLLPIFLMLVLGVADDLKKILSKKYHGVSAKLKFVIQTLITVLACYIGYYFNQNFNQYIIIIPFYGEVFFNLPLWLAFVISYFAFTGTVNAVNLTDGLDGLAGKQVLILLCFALTILYAIDFKNINFNIQDLKIIIFCFIGAILAFLFFNSNPAKIFMGDGGSMMLGCLIATIFIILKIELMLIFVGFVIFMEALSVILQVIYFKLTNGKRIFKMSPLHHHFQLNGIKEQKITELAFFITIMICILFLTAYV